MRKLIESYNNGYGPGNGGNGNGAPGSGNNGGNGNNSNGGNGNGSPKRPSILILPVRHRNRLIKEFEI